MRALAQNILDTKCKEASASVCFDALVRHYYRRLYSYARCLTHCSTQAEEITQEAFIRAYRFFHYYDPKRSFMAWVSRIAHNVFVDMRRSRRIEPLSLDAAEHLSQTVADETYDPEQILFNTTLNERLEQALQSLSPKLRTAILLCDVYGWTYEEIAQAMGCSSGTTRSRIHRGRQHLKEKLCEKGWETPQLLLSAC